MEILKRSILSRSSHTGEEFKSQRKALIERWLEKYNIENYTINDDFTIDVNGSIDLFFSKDLSEFPDYIQFGVVKGFFKCIHSQLTSLRGCPRKIERFFDCRYNKLTSLEGAPEEIGDFDCSYNKLTSLKGAPEKVKGGFYCSSNQLTSLEGAPKEADGFVCSKNPTQFTIDDVRKVCSVNGGIIC